MENNYFQGTTEHPYHISVGAVVRNARGEICCHYFDRLTHSSVGTFENLYLLMRETIEPGESIETCLARGLMEEFGMEAKLVSYLGSIVSRFPVLGTETMIEKTTLYFLCDYLSVDETKRKVGDVESGSVITWLPAEELIAKMKEQGIRLGREDADESVILERLKK
jgi:hypothetical protein